ncbi:MAG: siderophore ABC transporter substrate-binding protein [Ancrocorticia sp.]|uniref:siderophore ABC transporter substrate-binding protein n=1 Tax=Ancrocorticia sp. TaxID=2593684 RepID=UPI003F8DF55B
MRRSLLATLAGSALILSACGSNGDSTEEETTPAGDASTIEIEDNNGTHEVPVPPTSVVATDNRTFETLYDWDVDIAAAPMPLMPSTVGYIDDENIVDLGSHREPDLEPIVEVNPDVIINGQRFTQYHDDFVELAPDASIIELDPRDGEPFDTELKRQITTLGQVFDKESEAEALNGDLDAAVERVTSAYDPEQTVMAVNTSGGEIGFIAPGVGRAIGPLYDVLGLTPALEVEGSSDDHQGDDISVEAIADSNPDWILVMDRDAAVAADDPEYSPANELLESSEALANVTAVQEGQIVYMPADTYTNEGIQTYTEFLNDFADALEAAN